MSPAYRDLADQLAGQIHAGIYRPGDQLPSQSKLVGEGWGKQVAQDAYALLVERGLVEGRVGAGYFVLPTPGPEWLTRLEALEALEGRVAELERRLDERDRG